MKNAETIACNLGVFNEIQRQRHRKLAEEILTAFQEVKELSDGYAFRYINDILPLQRIEEWITLERLCCPFLNFKLESDKENSSVWLSLTGRDGVKRFLQAELDTFGVKITINP